MRGSKYERMTISRRTKRTRAMSDCGEWTKFRKKRRLKICSACQCECVCKWAFLSACACVRACMCACEHVCVCLCACVWSSNWGVAAKRRARVKNTHTYTHMGMYVCANGPANGVGRQRWWPGSGQSVRAFRSRVVLGAVCHAYDLISKWAEKLMKLLLPSQHTPRRRRNESLDQPRPMPQISAGIQRKAAHKNVFAYASLAAPPKKYWAYTQFAQWLCSMYRKGYEHIYSDYVIDVYI